MSHFYSLTIAEISLKCKIEDNDSKYIIFPNYAPFVSHPNKADNHSDYYIISYGCLPIHRIIEFHGDKTICSLLPLTVAYWKEGNEYIYCVQKKNPTELKLIAIVSEGFTQGRIFLEEEISVKRTLFFPLSQYFIDQFLLLNILHTGYGIRLHCCGIVYKEKAFLFVGKSGSGKSTIAKIFKANKEVTVLSDEYVILKRNNSMVKAYGTPWMSEVNAYSNSSADLGAVYFIQHDKFNNISLMHPVKSTIELIRQSSSCFLTGDKMEFVMSFCAEISESIPCFVLGFVPDNDVIDFVFNHKKV